MKKRSSVDKSPIGRPTKASAGHAGQPIYRVKAEFFRVLGHPARVRILEILRDGERSVGDLQAALATDSSSTSQHLGALRRQGVLESRRDGSRVLYRVKDPRIFQLLEVMREILAGAFDDRQAVLDELTDAIAESRTEQSEQSHRGRTP